MLGTGYTTTCIIIKLVNSLIQVAINFLERHMDTYNTCNSIFGYPV